MFESLDNPVKWPYYVYRAEYEGRGTNMIYKDHSLPIGATTVPLCTSRNRRYHNGWSFYYSGWDRPNCKNNHSQITTRIQENMFKEIII